MTLEEKIISQVHELPDAKKAEVLEFVNYLKLKNNDKDFSGFSLSSSLRGMENEDTPYSLDDIKE